MFDRLWQLLYYDLLFVTNDPQRKNNLPVSTEIEAIKA